jgi:hypothetical protein
MLNLRKMLLLMIGSLFLSASLTASAAGKVFVPGQYTPLSLYQEKVTSNAETLRFTVHVEVMSYVLAKNLAGFVAHQNPSGVVSYMSPTSFNPATGEVFLSTNLPGKYVIVADGFKNDFPVVTHWKQSLNAGRGGFEYGATDGIGKIDYIAETGSFFGSTDLFDENPENPYVFKSDKYALFSNDPLEPNARVPGPERYVGENYSVYAVTDIAAVALAAQFLEQTGYPLIHRNFPWANWKQGPLDKQTLNDLPAFQLAHNLVLAAYEDKPSLFTLLLPPRWSDVGSQTYPVLFNGFYDINENTFLANGLSFGKVIGQSLAKGQPGAIGVFWNGNGAFASQTLTFSSYFNSAYFFYVASLMFKADPQNVITFGISRGGSTALLTAANPFFNNYIVKYAISYCSPGYIGQIATEWLSTNFPGLYGNLGWATGYKYSYRSDFTDPVTGLKGPQMFLFNTTGFSEPYIADILSPPSDWMLTSLKAKGTQVHLGTGTSDIFIPTAQGIDIANQLKKHQIPFSWSIGHRGGHTYFDDELAPVIKALDALSGVSVPSFSGVKHYRRASESINDVNNMIEFSPSQYLEASLPKKAWPGQRVRLGISGQGSQIFAVAIQKIQDSAWLNSQQIIVEGAIKYIVVDQLSGSDIQYKSFDWTLDPTLLSGMYVYFLVHSRDNGASWSLIDFSKVPQPLEPRFSVFEVLASELTIPNIEISRSFNTFFTDRGWGLSEF